MWKRNEVSSFLIGCLNVSIAEKNIYRNGSLRSLAYLDCLSKKLHVNLPVLITRSCKIGKQRQFKENTRFYVVLM